jgi:hypothetical protein
VVSVKKTFPIELEAELHKRLKIAAIEEGLTLQDWILKTLAEKVGCNGTNAITSQERKRNARPSGRS